MAEGNDSSENESSSVSDRVFCSMCSSVLQVYQRILTEDECSRVQAILRMDSDSRRVLYSLYDSALSISRRCTKKSPFLFPSKCRVRVSSIQLVLFCCQSHVQCISTLMKERMVESCCADDVPQLLSELSVKEISTVLSMLHIDNVLSSKWR